MYSFIVFLIIEITWTFYLYSISFDGELFKLTHVTLHKTTVKFIELIRWG